MAELPFNIPPSLNSYLEQYDSAPRKTTARLKKLLHKRGADPIGYFLLGWFYHKQELNKEAVECALKAKSYAPGSPFFEKLHYFFSHPQLFDAWHNTAESFNSAKSGYNVFTKTGLLLDLDTLIEKLSQVESTRIQFDPNASSDVEDSFSKSLDDAEEIVSETLANIHEQQGKINAAIKAYKRLKVNNKEKEDWYEEQIKRLKKIKKKEK